MNPAIRPQRITGPSVVAVIIRHQLVDGPASAQRDGLSIAHRHQTVGGETDGTGIVVGQQLRVPGPHGRLDRADGRTRNIQVRLLSMGRGDQPVEDQQRNSRRAVDKAAGTRRLLRGGLVGIVAPHLFDDLVGCLLRRGGREIHIDGHAGTGAQKCGGNGSDGDVLHKYHGTLPSFQMNPAIRPQRMTGPSVVIR